MPRSASTKQGAIMWLERMLELDEEERRHRAMHNRLAKESGVRILESSASTVSQTLFSHTTCCCNLNHREPQVRKLAMDVSCMITPGQPGR